LNSSKGLNNVPASNKSKQQSLYNKYKFDNEKLSNNNSLE